MIKELEAQQRIEQVFLVIAMTKGVTNAGVPYFSVTLQDNSGTIDCRKWEVNPSDEETFEVGNFVKVNADVVPYRNSLQLKILSGVKMSEEDIELSDYMMAAPIPKEIMQKKLLGYVVKIKDKEIQRLVEAIVKEKLSAIAIYPAASKNHHEYVSGLLHHTVGMLDAADALCNVYPTLNRDLLLAGVILHDIGKTIEISGPKTPKYTVEGQLIGHISIMHAYVKEMADKLKIDEEVSLVLQHMVLSHHGELEYGSPVLPRIKEAEILSIIDNIDARINMMDKALNQIEEGEFTPRINALEGRAFYKPKLK